MAKFVILIAFLSLAAADVVPVKECSPDGSLPFAVDVVGCKQQPCELPRGQDATVYVDFTASKEVTKLRPVVHATVFGATVPFEMPGDRQNACDWLVDSRCPLSEGEDVRYQLALPVEKSYPAVSLTVMLELVDQDDETVTCFTVQAKVV